MTTNQEPPDSKKSQLTKDSSQEVNIKPPITGEPAGLKTVNNSQQIGTEQNKSQATPPPIGNPPPIPPINTPTTSSNLYPQISIELIQNPSRFYAVPLIGISLKFIMLIPLFLGLPLIIFVWLLIVAINSFYVLVTGKYWRLAYNFNLELIRILTKIHFFLAGLTNKYPGFSDKINDQFSVELDYPEHPNRLFAVPFLGGIVRYVLLVPFFIYAYVIQYAAVLGAFL
ncbi:MAG: hypothetical protein U1C56_00935, partial [Candidatus Curtissbacteria bacterium]|nr:hypothetical protein [Candidatus Curtissbacteria bacterium]